MTEIVVGTLGEEAFTTTARPVIQERFKFDRGYPEFRFSRLINTPMERDRKTDSRYLESDRFCKDCIAYKKKFGKTKFCSKCIDKNAIMRFGSIWFGFPHCPKPEKVSKDRITYNNSLSVAQIKQMLKKIDYENKRIGDTLYNIENMLYFLSIVYNYIDSEMKEDDYSIIYESILFEQKEIYLEFYNDTVKYFDNIPNLEQKYLTLLGAHKAGNKCVKCFAINGAETHHKEIPKIVLKRKKNCMTCNVCLSKRKEDTIVMDCPVCLEDFKKSKMTEAKCGNGHFLCNGCYEKMSRMKTDFGRKYTCPICRGTL